MFYNKSVKIPEDPKGHFYVWDHLDLLGGITELFRPGFSKTWVLV